MRLLSVGRTVPRAQPRRPSRIRLQHPPARGARRRGRRSGCPFNRSPPRTTASRPRRQGADDRAWPCHELLSLRTLERGKILPVPDPPEFLIGIRALEENQCCPVKTAVSLQDLDLVRVLAVLKGLLPNPCVSPKARPKCQNRAGKWRRLRKAAAAATAARCEHRSA
jgi:hypothetical protein